MAPRKAEKKDSDEVANVRPATECKCCGAKPKGPGCKNGSEWAHHSNIGAMRVPVDDLCKRCDQDRFRAL